MLLERLVDKRWERHLSNAEFARLLGISSALWFSIRSGRRGISATMLASILQNFPELKDDVLFHLANGGTIVPNLGTIEDTSDEGNLVAAG